MGFRTRRARRRLYGETGEGSFELEGEVSRRGIPYAKWIQSALNKTMGLQLAVDGDIGVKTRSAIRSFQQKNGLGVDGDVGPATEAALIRAGASPPQGFAPVPISSSSVPSVSTAPTIPNGGLTPIEDRTSITAKVKEFASFRKGTRKRVWALVLHHTAGSLKEKSEALDHVKAHFVITPMGRILQLHPIESLIWASNGLSPGSVAVEFVGNFRNEKGMCWYPRLIPLPCSQAPTPFQNAHGYFNRNGNCGYYGGQMKPCSNTPTTAQIRAGRDLIQYLIKKIGLTDIYAHRQSSATREGDPGPDIWYHVGQWAVDLGLNDGGSGYKHDKGNPIPDVWRTWGRTQLLGP